MSDVKAYTRVVRTPEGGSAFEDAELDLAERRISAGVPPMLTGGMAGSGAVTFLRSEEFDSDPHPAPREQWVVMIRGVIEVQVSGGARRRFGPGELVFVSDTRVAGTSRSPSASHRSRPCS